MDTKALAKSKRAHSVHHNRKHHSHHASKSTSASSAATGDGKNPMGKQAREKPQKSHGPRKLPSNWDRYDEEFDLGSEDRASESTSQPTEFVIPKSKGSDFAYLISEAKAQSQGKYSSEFSPAQTDIFDDFTQELGPLLSAKGQSLRSWIADDTFEFEDNANTSDEVPFLSLNLDALARQLGMAKLSERLFLEPDRIPQEFLDDESQACVKDKHDQEQTGTSATGINSVASTLGHKQDAIEYAQEHNKPASSDATMTTNNTLSTSEEISETMKQIEDETLPLRVTDSSTLPDSFSKLNVNSAARNPPMFEAASAEAELDFLLDSFTETKILNSSDASSVDIMSSGAVSDEPVKEGKHSTKSTSITAHIDDVVDDLLEETNWKKVDKQPSLGANTPPVDLPSTVVSGSKSKLLDDFDSWFDTI